MTITQLSFKNLMRKRFRTMVIVLAAAVAAGLVFSATTVLESVEGSLELGLERLGADIMIVPSGYESKGQRVLLAGEPTSFYMKGENLASVRGVEGVATASPQIFVTSSVLMCCSMPTVLLVGYDPATDFTITPWVQHTYNISKEAYDEVIIGAQTLYASEGVHMTFFGKPFKIGKSLHPTGMAYLDYSIFMTVDAARSMIETSKTKSSQPVLVDPGSISSILVKTVPGTPAGEIAKRIEAKVPGVKAMVTRDMISQVKSDVRGSLFGVISAGWAAWGMTLVLIGIVFSMIVAERQREIGILRAMGASRFHITRLILSEAFLLTGTGGILGVGGGLIAILVFRRLIVASLGKVDFLWPSPVVIGGIGATCFFLLLLSGGIAAAWPAIRSSRKDPYEAVRAGG